VAPQRERNRRDRARQRPARNVVHDNEDTGLNFYTGGNNNLAALNVSYNNGDHGIDDFDVTGGRLIGNTMYHNCTSGTKTSGAITVWRTDGVPAGHLVVLTCSWAPLRAPARSPPPTPPAPSTPTWPTWPTAPATASCCWPG
jgi:hypothetical protein